jgi:hypothetical protein
MLHTALLARQPQPDPALDLMREEAFLTVLLCDWIAA